MKGVTWHIELLLSVVAVSFELKCFWSWSGEGGKLVEEEGTV